MKTAYYMRVSKSEQDISMQERSISLFLQSKGILNAQGYADDGFTGKNENRPQFKALVNDIKAGAIELLVVYKLDRLCRSLTSLLALFTTLKEYNVKFISISDNLDLTTSVGVLTMHMLGAVAEFERNLIVERTKEGLANARSKGIVIGRPIKIGIAITANIIQLYKAGVKVPAIAIELNISQGSIYRILSKNNTVKLKPNHSGAIENPSTSSTKLDLSIPIKPA